MKYLPIINLMTTFLIASIIYYLSTDLGKMIVVAFTSLSISANLFFLFVLRKKEKLPRNFKKGIYFYPITKLIQVFYVITISLIIGMGVLSGV